jgi:hypothetical protein
LKIEVKFEVAFSGIPDIAEDNSGVVIFPNPATDVINFDFTDKMFGVQRIIFHEITGRVVKTFDCKSEDHLNLRPDLANGVYLLEIHGKTRSIIKRIQIIETR